MDDDYDDDYDDDNDDDDDSYYLFFSFSELINIMYVFIVVKSLYVYYGLMAFIYKL